MSDRDTISAECDHCGAVNECDPIHEGETLRSTTCVECGEFFVVHRE